MDDRIATPEQVIREMSVTEVRELLRDLSVDSTVETAIRFQRLVSQLNDFEKAMNRCVGPATMRPAITRTAA